MYLFMDSLMYWKFGSLLDPRDPEISARFVLKVVGDLRVGQKYCLQPLRHGITHYLRFSTNTPSPP